MFSLSRIWCVKGQLSSSARVQTPGHLALVLPTAHSRPWSSCDLGGSSMPSTDFWADRVSHSAPCQTHDLLPKACKAQSFCHLKLPVIILSATLHSVPESGTNPVVFIRISKGYICIRPENLQNCCICLSQPTQSTVITVFNSILESVELLSPEPLPGTATKPTLRLKHPSGSYTPAIRTGQTVTDAWKTEARGEVWLQNTAVSGKSKDSKSTG